MSETAPTLRELAQDATHKLTDLRDRLRPRQKLITRDLGDLWERDLEPFLESIQKRLSRVGDQLAQTGDKAEAEAHLGLRDAERAWKDVRLHLETLGRDITGAAKEVRTEIDRTRIQAHLARLDADDAISERTEHMVGQLKETRKQVTEEARQLLDELRKSIEQIRTS